MLDYLRDGAEIYRRSFATIRAEADLTVVPPHLEQLAVRVIHACGMVDIVADLCWSAGAGTAGREALRAGAAILCDSAAVARGITRSRMPAINPILLADADAQDQPFGGKLVAIGTSVTLLDRVLGAPAGERPALVLGFPAGFNGESEAKDRLARSDLPFVTVRGTRGGSAMAVAAVNALASERE